MTIALFSVFSSLIIKAIGSKQRLLSSSSILQKAWDSLRMDQDGITDWRTMWWSSMTTSATSFPINILPFVRDREREGGGAKASYARSWIITQYHFLISSK